MGSGFPSSEYKTSVGECPHPFSVLFASSPEGGHDVHLLAVVVWILVAKAPIQHATPGRWKGEGRKGRYES